MALDHNGNLTDAVELWGELKGRGLGVRGSADSEIIAALLATLSLTFTAMAEDSSVLPACDQRRVAQALEDDAEGLTNTQLAELPAAEPRHAQDQVPRTHTARPPRAPQRRSPATAPSTVSVRPSGQVTAMTARNVAVRELIVSTDVHDERWRLALELFGQLRDGD